MKQKGKRSFPFPDMDPVAVFSSPQRRMEPFQRDAFRDRRHPTVLQPHGIPQKLKAPPLPILFGLYPAAVGKYSSFPSKTSCILRFLRSIFRYYTIGRRHFQSPPEHSRALDAQPLENLPNKIKRDDRKCKHQNIPNGMIGKRMGAEHGSSKIYQ